MLDGRLNNRIYGVTTGNEELINGATHTISGGGQLGNNFLKLTNQGLIDANLSNPLTIDPSSGGVTNTGILQASNSATLNLTGGTFTNTGTLRAFGGGTLNLTGGSTFTNTGGVIQAFDGSLVQLSNISLVGGTLSRVGTTGRIVVPNNTTLTLAGPITLNAPLEVNSTGSVTDLKINGNFTLSGSENVVLSNSVNNRIYGVTATDVLTLPTGRTIAGAGQIGVNLMGLANQGTIDANLSNPLTIDPSSAGVTNTGTLQASNNATLNLTGGTFTNTGGVIQALNGSLVQLNNMTLVGGTLSRAGTGRIAVPNNTTLTLTGPTITLNAPLEINSTGSVTNLKINGNVTLSGSGNVVLSNNTNNRVSGVTATDVLTLSAGQTISGAGQVGFNLMGLVNQGTIDANLSNPLTIDPSSAGVTNTGLLQASNNATLSLTGGTFTNTGTLQAIGGGTLNLTGGSTFTNTGGVIQALDGSLVQLNSMTLVGGTLSRAGTGRIVVPNNTTVTLAGPITLNAPLEVNSTGSVTNLKINGNLTLSGSGNVVLSNNTNNRVSGVTATDVLTLSAGQTISGAGQVGFNLMGLVNQGTIDANLSNPLTIDPSSAGVTNTGILQASNNATLSLTGGTFTNTGGVIQALNGSQVRLEGATVVGGTLSGAGTGLIVNDFGILRGSGSAGLQLTGGTFLNYGIVEALNGSNVTYSSSAVEENSRVGVLIAGTWRIDCDRRRSDDHTAGQQQHH